MSREVLRAHRIFLRLYDRFHALFPAFWFAAVGLILVSDVAGLDRRLGFDVAKAGGFVALLLIAAWLGLNGIVLLWELPLRAASQCAKLTWARAVLCAALMLTGVIFVSFSLNILKSGARDLLKYLGR